MTIPLPPATPERSDAPTIFATKASAFVGWIANSLVPAFNADLATINGNAQLCAQAQINAANSAAIALAAAGAVLGGPNTMATYAGSLTAAVATGITITPAQPNRVWGPGTVLRFAEYSNPTANRFIALVTAYDAAANGGLGSLTFNITAVEAGAGAHLGWSITPAASAGLLAASAADVRDGTSNNVSVTPTSLFTAATFQALVEASPVTWDTRVKGFNVILALNANRTIAAPTGLYDGLTYVIGLAQAGGGSHTLAWNAIFDWGAEGPPVLSLANGVYDWAYGQYSAGLGKLIMNFRAGA